MSMYLFFPRLLISLTKPKEKQVTKSVIHGCVESKIIESCKTLFNGSATKPITFSLLSLKHIVQVSDYFYNYYLITTKVLDLLYVN